MSAQILMRSLKKNIDGSGIGGCATYLVLISFLAPDIVVYDTTIQEEHAWTS